MSWCRHRMHACQECMCGTRCPAMTLEMKCVCEALLPDFMLMSAACHMCFSRQVGAKTIAKTPIPLTCRGLQQHDMLQGVYPFLPLSYCFMCQLLLFFPVFRCGTVNNTNTEGTKNTPWYKQNVHATVTFVEEITDFNPITPEPTHTPH